MALLLLCPEGFAQNGIVPTYTTSFDTFPPSSWRQANGGSATSGPPTFGSSAWTAEEFAHNFNSGGGAVNVLISGANTRDWLVTPEFDLSAGNYEMDFRTAITAVDNQGKAVMGSDDLIAIVYTEDAGNTWSILKTIDMNSANSNVEIFNSIDLSGITGTNVTFAILADTGSIDDNAPYDFHLDDFEIDAAQDCSTPALIVVDDLNTTTATFTFQTTNENATGNYEFAITNPFDGDPTIATPLRRGFFPGATGAGTVTKVIGEGTGPDAPLAPNTDYDIYFREECTAGTFSAWSERINFKTLCNTVAATFPTDADFINHVPDPCWREATKGNPSIGADDFGESEWRGGRAYTNRDGNPRPSNTIRLHRAEVNDWLISGVYDVNTSASDVLSVEVAVTPYLTTGVSPANQTAQMGSDDEVSLWYRDRSAGTTGPWILLEKWDSSNSPAATGQRSFIDLSNVTGNVEFAFYATDGDIDDVGVDIDFHIGLFFVDAVASTDYLQISNFSLYPNPVGIEGIINLEMNQQFTESTSVQIFDLNGKQLRSYEVEAGRSDLRIDDIEALSSGLYLLSIQNSTVNETIKFVKN
jgi:hypothetical protein